MSDTLPTPTSDRQRMRIVMMGTGVFAEPTFEALLAAGENVVGLATQPDRDVGRRTGASRQTGTGMKAIAEKASIPVIQPESINTPQGLNQLQAFSPDLVVVAAYGQILKPAVLAIPPLGMINVHASLLPKFRGAAPVAYAIWQGEKQTGVTIIRITPGLDSGEMLARGTLDILPTETTGQLEVRLARLGASLCVDVVQKFNHGPVQGEKQDPAQVTKAPKITKEMGLIDWSRTAAGIDCHIRAMQPWPTPYTFLHRAGKPPQRVIVLSVRNGDPQLAKPEAQPGTVVDAGPGKLVIRTGGAETLEILEIQPSGKKRMTVPEFLRGYPVKPGERFGPE